MKIHALILGAFATTGVAISTPLSAATIQWANWSPTFTQGNPTGGAANGALGSTTVDYSGQLINLSHGYPSWGAPGTFDGGTVGNAPPSAFGMIQLNGGNTTINTLTFATAVVNPILAIWSLGANVVTSIPASFTFSQPFTIQSGGPSSEYGGGPLTTSDNLTISGLESNGTIQFTGTFTQLSWTNSQFENYFGFTVGIPNAAVGETPLPGALPLFATGITALGLIAYRKKRNQAA